MSEGATLVLSATAVSIAGRVLAMEGPPGCGKSSLALALIDRGAMLVGDDGITLTRAGDTLIATPPPNIDGLLEIRGVGLVNMAIASPAPLALMLSLGETGERLPQSVPSRMVLGLPVPVLPFEPGTIAPAPRAEWALQQHGLKQGLE